METYSDDVRLEIGENSSVELPSRDYASRLPKEFLIDESLIQFNLTTIFNKYQVRLSVGRSYFSRCSVCGCTNTDVQIHHLKKLHRKVDRSGQTSVLNR
jgi:predicted restriction endonuclease